MLILNGDCLELLKEVPDQSIDLIFCDLPYGQTSCKWDCKIDLDKLWIEFMRVKKLNTPLFFTTTTKFGVELINSAPKQCFFRYDIVWVKSAPAGFLSAKRMPLRKHEMVYVFYEKLPFYDLSSHKHKFVKEVKPNPNRDNKSICYGEGKAARGVKYTEEYREKHGKKEYKPPLPVSVVKEETGGATGEERKINPKNSNKGGLYSNIDRLEDVKYDPPLPVSVIKEPEPEPEQIHSKNYGTDNRKNPLKQMGSQTGNKGYDPPLPVSVVKEPEPEPEPELIYGKNANWGKKHYTSKERASSVYDPPLPVSVVKEPEPEPEPEPQVIKKKEHGPCKNYGVERVFYYDENGNKLDGKDGTNTKYDPPLPTSICEVKSTRGKHSTEKPVALMEWILKYYSKEGDVVLDPTMGSGSMGVACLNLKRDFVGFEKDDEIFEVACQRLTEGNSMS